MSRYFVLMLQCVRAGVASAKAARCVLRAELGTPRSQTIARASVSSLSDLLLINDARAEYGSGDITDNIRMILASNQITFICFSS